MSARVRKAWEHRSRAASLAAAGALLRACGEAPLASAPSRAKKATSIHPDIVVPSVGSTAATDRAAHAGDARHLDRPGAYARPRARGLCPARGPRQGVRDSSRRRAQHLGGECAPEDARRTRAHALHPSHRPARRAFADDPLAHVARSLRPARRSRRRDPPDGRRRGGAGAGVARLSGGSAATGIMLADPDEARRLTEAFVRARSTPSPRGHRACAGARRGCEGQRASSPDASRRSPRLQTRASRAAKSGSNDAGRWRSARRFALAALEHLAGNGAPQLVVEAMVMRMRAVMILWGPPVPLEAPSVSSLPHGGGRLRRSCAQGGPPPPPPADSVLAKRGIPPPPPAAVRRARWGTSGSPRRLFGFLSLPSGGGGRLRRSRCARKGTAAFRPRLVVSGESE